ncbi:MAG TPA: DUF885 domain-containing protein [Thermoplasmata archaeon]|jgi:uncharacterized protein (DUF885 family)
MASKEFDALNNEMLKKYLAVNPDGATAMGLHDPYDYHLPHGGFKKIEDSMKILEEWSKKGYQIAKTSPLSLEQRMGLQLIDQSIELQRFVIDEYPMWKMFPDGLDMPGGLLFLMLSRDYAPFEDRTKAMVSRLNELPRYLEEFRSRFDGSSHVKVWTEMAIETCEQLPGFLKFIEATAHGKVSPPVMAELKKSIAQADKALKDHLGWLNKMLATARGSFPMGEAKMARLLQIRGLGMTPEQLMALGEKLLAEFKEEKRKVSSRISKGKSVEEAAKIVQGKSPKTFEEALEATKKEMLEAKSFIARKGLATIDPDAKLEVVETPDFLAPVLPFAALYPPSYFDKRQEGQYVVTRPGDPKDLSNHLNYAAIINTAVHEAYPGHFHQGVMTNKKHWILQMSPPEAPAAGVETFEGWAHYCEKMMFDHGYKATDEAAFELLNGAIWRACRIIADIKLAHGTATVEEMTEFMTRETGMPRDAMENEAKRYSRTPSYALSYMTGRHLILEFRKEVERKAGVKFDERKFHDLVASYGTLPFNLLREVVLTGLGLPM